MFQVERNWVHTVAGFVRISLRKTGRSRSTSCPSTTDVTDAERDITIPNSTSSVISCLNNQNSARIDFWRTSGDDTHLTFLRSSALTTFGTLASWFHDIHNSPLTSTSRTELGESAATRSFCRFWPRRFCPDFGLPEWFIRVVAFGPRRIFDIRKKTWPCVVWRSMQLTM